MAPRETAYPIQANLGQKSLAASPHSKCRWATLHFADIYLTTSYKGNFPRGERGSKCEVEHCVRADVVLSFSPGL